jgi:hypothetical protein
MATHELYVGGPPTTNSGLGFYPAPAFNEAAAPFTTMEMAAHKGPNGYSDTRLLDFTGPDHALAHWVRNATIAQGDVLGAIIITKNHLYLGFYYKVISPVAGLSITPRLRGKSLTYTAIDASAAAEGYVAPGSGAIITEGAVTLAAAQYDNKPDIFDLVLTAYTAGTLHGLKMIVSPNLISVANGGYR